jgi:oligopeptide transport system substrate-binding protein
MEQYLQGQIDFLEVGWFPGDIVRAAQRRYGQFYTVLNPRPATFSISFDSQQSPFGDVRVRRALALAIDQKQLISDLQMDDATPALGGYVPPGVPGYAAEIGLPHDPESARRLLADAGYPDGQGFPALELVWFDLPSLREAAEYISQFWSDMLGLKIRPVFWSLPKAIEAFGHGTLPAMFGGGWSADYHDPDCFLRVGLHGNIRHHRPILDRIEAARNTTDQGKRLALYQEVDKMVIDEAICIPLYYSEYPSFFGPRVRKVSPDFRWSEFIVDPD